MQKESKAIFLKNKVENIANFPVDGIQFKDVTPLFEDSESLKILTETLTDLYKDKGITKVIGIESRGFIMGPILAMNLNAGFVPIRKEGKLPRKTLAETYEKEYGVDKIEIHIDAINKNDIILIHDDLLATGGTMVAAYNLIRKMGVENIYINFLIELEDLNGRSLFPENVEVESLMKFEI